MRGWEQRITGTRAAASIAVLCVLSVLAVFSGGPAHSAPVSSRGLTDAGEVPWSESLVTTTSGALVSASSFTHRVTWMAPSGDILFDVTLPIDASRLAAEPDGSVLAFAPVGFWHPAHAQAVRVTETGSVELVDVPELTVDISIGADGRAAAVDGTGDVYTRAAGADRFIPTAYSSSNTFTRVVVSGDAVYACGHRGLYRFGKAGVDQLTSSRCPQLAADLDGGVYATGQDDLDLLHFSDSGTTGTPVFTLTRATWMVADPLVLSDGTLAWISQTDIVWRLDPGTGTLAAISPGSLFVAGDGGWERPTSALNWWLAAADADSVYLQRRVSTSEWVIDRLAVADSEATTFALYPTVPTLRGGSSMELHSTWSGPVRPGQFTIIWGSLPPGTSLDPDTGIISGAPSTRGVYTVTVGLSPSPGTLLSQSLTIPVAGTTAGRY